MLCTNLSTFSFMVHELISNCPTQFRCGRNSEDLRLLILLLFLNWAKKQNYFVKSKIRFRIVINIIAYRKTKRVIFRFVTDFEIFLRKIFLCETLYLREIFTID